MISAQEREYLRTLAARQKELAESDRNRELEKRWTAHNALQKGEPLAVIETETFWKEICPPLRCTDPDARAIEERILFHLVPAELIGDDRMVPAAHRVPLQVQVEEFGIKKEKQTSSDASSAAYQYKHPLQDLETDLDLLKPSTFSHNLSAARAQADLAEDIFGDILPVEIENQSLLWHVMPTQKVVDLMGMENYFMSMYDTPDELHQLMRFITDDLIRCIRWEEEEGILTPNWADHYAGSSNFGYTSLLPASEKKNIDLRRGKTDIKMRDLWLNINSQESVGISREMFEEFVLPYYKELCAQAGLVYYGCCEPVHGIFTGGLDQIGNIRKLSISAWCDEASIAEQLKGKNIIYSRKPSANFLGVGEQLDEDAFRAYMQKTMDLTRDLNVEVIFRDVYTLSGNTGKLKTALRILRECAAKR